MAPEEEAKSGGGDSASSTALSSFERLNRRVSLYVPASGPDVVADPSHPKLILFHSWMDAPRQHIAKFIAHYATIYPATPILLVTSSNKDFFPPMQTLHRAAEVAPAITAVKSYIDDVGRGNNANGDSDSNSNSGGSDGKPPALLAHAFSNGGAGSLGALAQHYRAATGRPLPVAAVLLDSAPGAARLRDGVRTLSLGLPRALYLRLPLQAIIALALLVFYTIPGWLGLGNLATRMRARLNALGPAGGDGGGSGQKITTTATGIELLRRQAPRCYLYGKGDVVCLDRDVEAHAVEARKKGILVRMERFDDSIHVGHMRIDPERYWRIVRECWETRA